MQKNLICRISNSATTKNKVEEVFVYKIKKGAGEKNLRRKKLCLTAAFAAEGLTGREKLFQSLCFLRVLGGYLYLDSVFDLLGFILEVFSKAFGIATEGKHLFSPPFV